MKVLCLWYATQEEIDNIKRAMPVGTEVVAPKGEYFSRFECDYSDIERHAVDADAFIALAVPEGAVEIAGKLKILCWLHAGCDDLDLPLLRKCGVKVTNVRGANSIAIAEQAMMFVLALAKKTLFKHQLALEGHRPFPLWADEHRSGMLNGRTIGVIGVGNIGSRIAKHAKAFDMQVLGIRHSREKPADFVDSMHGMDELNSVLTKCDYVVLATPITKETHQFFGKSAFAAMKPSAFLVNVARGNLIQEKPLYEALTSGRLRGYAADVWWSYDIGRAFPIGSWSPSRLGIERLPNVLCSLGQAHNADDVLERNLQSGIQSLAEFATGKPLTREINLDLGY